MRIMSDFTQRSPEWYATRRGKITMSNAALLMTKGRGITRATYLQSVAAEVVAPEYVVAEYQSMDMNRGIELEPYALRALSDFLDIELTSVGFALADDERIGCSPDAIPLQPCGVVIEVKCPAPKAHLRYLDPAHVARDHGAQMQGEMWVCHAERVYFASFCPWVVNRPLTVHELGRDEEFIAALSRSAIEGADEVEKMVKAIRENHCPAEILTIAKEASEYWESLSAMKDEVTYE